MTTDDALLRQARGPVAPPRLRSSARIYASPTVIDLLADVATAPRIAVCVDIDALQRTTLATVDRIMRCALNALCHLNVQVILAAHHERERAALLHDALSSAWWIENTNAAGTLARLRARLPGIALIGISDDPALLDALADHDRGIALGTRYAGTRANIAATADLSVRATLWWIVDVRWKAGMITGARPLED